MLTDCKFLTQVSLLICFLASWMATNILQFRFQENLFTTNDYVSLWPEGCLILN